ncbi:hypothetical protein MBRA_53840 (plasmid) [Mycobacterium branderi]|uniref:Resolvase/invertase-type recombinase catalytic domain-containing protein n=1 Tax=Mycobacterium branderi TaxID=43348 RepID=A0ABM7KVL1_9MYCO|nr:hypothetical protein MBRA_53840 [Mycobacterium branderi]
MTRPSKSQAATLIATGVNAEGCREKMDSAVGLCCQMSQCRAEGSHSDAHRWDAGDTIVVAAIDRLGRSLATVARTIAELGGAANPAAHLTRRNRRRHAHGGP